MQAGVIRTFGHRENAGGIGSKQDVRRDREIIFGVPHGFRPVPSAMASQDPFPTKARPGRDKAR
jgi:hypothetical protein